MGKRIGFIDVKFSQAATAEQYQRLERAAYGASASVEDFNKFIMGHVGSVDPLSDPRLFDPVTLRYRSPLSDAVRQVTKAHDNLDADKLLALTIADMDHLATQRDISAARDEVRPSVKESQSYARKILSGGIFGNPGVITVIP